MGELFAGRCWRLCSDSMAVDEVGAVAVSWKDCRRYESRTVEVVGSIRLRAANSPIYSKKPARAEQSPN